MNNAGCSICGRKVHARGLCNAHYMRWRRNGDPLIGAPVREQGIPTEVRFWQNVDKSAGPDMCWLWTGSRMSSGYGRIRAGDRKLSAHRVAYTLAKGDIPSGMQVDHMCHARHCCNPSHLRLATPKQNGENRRQTQRNSSSGVRGVFLDKRRERWYAQVGHNGKQIHVGTFATLEEAAEAVRLKRLELFSHSDMDLAS
jgi:hypothetical protein